MINIKLKNTIYTISYYNVKEKKSDVRVERVKFVLMIYSKWIKMKQSSQINNQGINIDIYDIIEYNISSKYNFNSFMNDYKYVMEHKSLLGYDNDDENDKKDNICDVNDCFIIGRQERPKYHKNDTNQLFFDKNIDQDDIHRSRAVQQCLDSAHCFIYHTMRLDMDKIKRMIQKITKQKDNDYAGYHDEFIANLHKIRNKTIKESRRYRNSNRNKKFNKFMTTKDYQSTKSNIFEMKIDDIINDQSDNTDKEERICFLDNLMHEMVHKYNVSQNIVYKLWHYLINEEYDSDGIHNDYQNRNTEDVDDTESQIKQLLKSLISKNNQNERDLFYTNNILIEHVSVYVNFSSIYFSSYRFFYWDYYKNNNNKFNILLTHSKTNRNRIETNDGYRLCDWYITPRFSSFKQEILSCLQQFSLFNFSIRDWNDILMKSKLKLNAYKYDQDNRKLQCGYQYTDDNGNDYYSSIDYGIFYGIQQEQDITIPHIMSLLFYTNYTKQSYEFSASFRKVWYNETDESLKKRHSNFAQWARLLRECVECFGCPMKYSSTPIYYHGISKQLLFDSTSFIINGPMSTTAGLCNIFFFLQLVLLL